MKKIGVEKGEKGKREVEPDGERVKEEAKKEIEKEEEGKPDGDDKKNRYVDGVINSVTCKILMDSWAANGILWRNITKS